MNNDVILITGGLGGLGVNLVSNLLNTCNANTKFIIIDKNKVIISLWNQDPRIKIINDNLNNPKVWRSLDQNITHVFYLAAIIPWKKEDKNKSIICINNIQPLANLIEYSNSWKELKQVIYSSSISVYKKSNSLLTEDSIKQPSDIYGASKLAGENLILCLESRGITITSLRYSSLYGYGQYPNTVLPIMINNTIKKKEIYVYGDGSRKQDFLHYDDAANANILAFKKNISGVFNIGSGISITMNELAIKINKIFSDSKSKIIHLNDKPQEENILFDITKAKKVINYDPVINIDLGLRKIKNILDKKNE